MSVSDTPIDAPSSATAWLTLVVSTCALVALCGWALVNQEKLLQGDFAALIFSKFDSAYFDSASVGTTNNSNDSQAADLTELVKDGAGQHAADEPIATSPAMVRRTKQASTNRVIPIQQVSPGGFSDGQQAAIIDSSIEPQDFNVTLATSASAAGARRLLAEKVADSELAMVESAVDNEAMEQQASTDSVVKKLVADRALAEKLALREAAADALAAEQLVAEKLIAEKLAIQKATTEKQAIEKAASVKLTAKKLAAEKLAADKLAAEEAKKLAAEEAVAKKLAAAKKLAEEKKLAAQRETARKLAAEKAAAQGLAARKLVMKNAAAKKAAEKIAADKLTAEKALAKQAAVESTAEQKAAAKKLAAELAVAGKLATRKNAKASKAEVDRLAAQKQQAEQLAALPIRSIPSVDTLVSAPSAVPKDETTFEKNRREALSDLAQISSKVVFESNDLEPLDSSIRVMDQLFELLFLYSETQVTVQVSSNEYEIDNNNRLISRERALTLVNYLIDRGLDEQRFRIRALGKQRLSFDTHRVMVIATVVDK